MEKTAMTRYSDVFNTLKDHDNEISSPGAGFTAGRMLNKDTSSRCASTAARYWYGKSGVSVLSGERGEQILYKARRAYVPSANCQAGK